MSEPELRGADDAGGAEAPSPTAGALLAQARHAAGLTVDGVASQLKLAPRQVVAIERDDFGSLPGRTFVRGFVRNYARLLKLDVDAVMAALPGNGEAPASDRAPAPATGRSIGEMPRESRRRPGAARWVIPLLLAAIVGVAAFYEFARPPATDRGAATRSETVAAPQTAVAPPPADPAGAARPADPVEVTSSAPAKELPNPVAESAVPSSVAAGAAPAAPDAAGRDAAAAQNRLSLAFRGTSWIEVRDRSGGTVLSITGTSGTTRELQVAPPAELVVGNAAAVDVTWRGKGVDLAPVARQNVARVRLD